MTIKTPSIFLLASLMPTLALGQDAELRTLAGRLAEQISGRGLGVVAVTGFVNSEYGPQFNNYVVNRLGVMLVQTGKPFEVVTRNKIESAYRELDLKYGRHFDEETFSKIGQFTGADVVVTGDFNVFSSKVNLTSQLIDVRTGRIVGGDFIDIGRTADVNSLLGSTVEQTVDEGSASETPDSPDETKPSAGTQIVESGGFVLELQFCDVAATLVTCQIRVVSPGRDQTLRFGNWYGASSLFDQSGYVYENGKVEIGNLTRNSSVDARLVRDVPVIARIHFPVTADVTFIPLLEIKAGSDQEFPVQFRDIQPR